MLRKFILENSSKFISHWLILAIDLSVVAVSMPLAYLIVYNLSLDQLSLEAIYAFALQAGPLYLLGFMIFQSHKGIVRHTSLADALKVFGAAFMGGCAMVLLRIASDNGAENLIHKFSYATIAIHFFLSVIFLISLRFFVKIIYFRLVRGNMKYERVLIYGAGLTGMLTKGSLMRDDKINYKLVAFLDDSPNKIGKLLEGVHVMNANVLKGGFLVTHKIDTLIIAMTNFSSDKKNQLVEYCLRDKVDVKQTPPVKDWFNGQLEARSIRKVKIEDLLQRAPIQLRTENLQAKLSGKVVMVTGAAGSIGSEIARQLTLNNVSKVVLVDQGETPLYELNYELQQSVKSRTRVMPYVASVLNEERMEQIIRAEKPEVIYHAAAYKHVPMMQDHPTEAIQTNVFGTKVMVDLACKYDVDKFVLVSTDKAVNPSSVMGMTKRMAEVYVQCIERTRKFNTKFITTRFGNVLGSNGSVIPLFEKQINSGGPITITHPDVTRYFMTIPEACHLVLEAGVMGQGGELFTFDMGQPVKIVDMARKMILLSGYQPDRDIEIQYIGLRKGEKLYEELHYETEEHITTHHPQILITKMPEFDINGVFSYLEKLSDDRVQMEEMELISNLKDFIGQTIAPSAGIRLSYSKGRALATN
ncbi:MAG: nucleoside-diphosphate sugar epimerase/dehydratase [Imperialibacter sp.]|uniref:polysaccharide biosynthesis protein n=1 Tax=Imperialibacter sp. TaxID=2038411 RepID=UPI0032EC7DFF